MAILIYTVNPIKIMLQKKAAVYFNTSGISCLSSVMMLQPDQVVLSTNLFFKLDVSFPLVTGELLQNTVDVTSVAYKLYNIKI